MTNTSLEPMMKKRGEWQSAEGYYYTLYDEEQ
jgi:hypothetical protein